MQYVSQQGNHIGFSSPPELWLAKHHDWQAFGRGELTPSTTGTITGSVVNAGATVNSGTPVSGIDEDQFGTDMPMDRRKRSSWHTVWSNSLSNLGPLAHYHMNQQTQLMSHVPFKLCLFLLSSCSRRLSLRCTTSTGSTSSDNSSGFGSATLGSSFSTGEHSFDSSRRSSRNTCASDVSETYRNNAPSFMGNRTGMDEVSLSGWTGLPGQGTASGPRALRGSGASSAPWHSTSGSGSSLEIRTNLAQNAVGQFPVLPSESPRSARTNTPDAFGEKLSPCETGSGRRHHMTSHMGKESVFWPSDPGPVDKSRFSDCLDAQSSKLVSHKGNMFKPRQNFAVFQKLPAHKRNAYFIQMDDDSCTGNEDTRAFLLAQLTNHRISEVPCLACHQLLVVYDHFPVVDGIFFISPVCHRSTHMYSRHTVNGLRITWHTNGVPSAFQQPKQTGANADPEEMSQELIQKLLGNGMTIVPPPGCLGPRQQVTGNHGSPEGNISGQLLHQHSHFQNHHNAATGRHGAGRQERYLHALCMGCMHHGISENEDNRTADSVGGRFGGIFCRSCLSPWSGAGLLVGGLYTYDVLAAWPCCPDRLKCNACGRQLVATSTTNQADLNGHERFSTPGVHTEKENVLEQDEEQRAEDMSLWWNTPFQLQANPPLLSANPL
ncbi:unnamed protein product [Echinostoma caproni]|uniref:Headcase middle domain-containing protein n=1 Tax=Echinostoma caproni TaxID=27848 RepID=A0A3P8KHE7_9TREM|nr:unnamed protein product [Echinostoma caproni]